MDKKYLRQVAAYLLTAAVSVGLMLYICYHLFYGLTQKVETAPALVSTVTRSVDADAFIFRDPRPLSSSASHSAGPVRVLIIPHLKYCLFTASGLSPCQSLLHISCLRNFLGSFLLLLLPGLRPL